MNDIKFSKSRFDTQKKCLGIYHYKYIEKLETSSVIYPATVIGEAVHYYLELFFTQINEEHFNWAKQKIHKPTLTYKQFIEKTKLRLFTDVFSEYLDGVKADKTKEFRLSRGWKLEDFLKVADSWVWEILKFLIKLFEYGQFSSELEFSCKYKNVEVNGIIDLVLQVDEDLYVVDFKTTKDSSTYYFVNWDNDPQSLVYYYALWKEKGIKIKKFSYFCFNMENKTILVNSIEYTKDYTKNFEDIIKKFLVNHKVSSDKKKWTPSQNNCRWCDFKKQCPVGIK